MSDTDSPVSAPDEAPNLYAENVRLQVEAFRLRANNERLRAALEKINVGEGWAALIARAALEGRTCTCHPSEAPTTCQRKYALGECTQAALEGRT